MRSVQVVRDEGFYPHSPVRLFLSAAPRRILLRRLVAPRRISAQLPPSCANAGMLEQPPAATPITTAEELDCAHDEFIVTAENFWDHLDATSGSTKRVTRAAGPRFRWTPALGQVAQRHRFSSAASSTWRLLARHLHVITRAIVLGLRPCGAGGAAKQAAAAWRGICAAAAPSKRDGQGMARCREWALGLVDNRWRTISELAELVEEAARQAARAEAEVRKRLEREWHDWIHGGPAQGLGRQHRFSRTPIGWAPARVASGVATAVDELDDEGVSERDLRLLIVPSGEPAQPLCAQLGVEAEADQWAGHWDAAPTPAAPKWPTDLGPLPAPIVTDHLLAAAVTFPEETGLGWDSAHPRALLRLPRFMIDRLVLILMAAELIGHWPRSIALVLIALLPKADGGLRPIGLMPMIIRLWTRARRIVAHQWELRHERPYFTLGRGRGRWLPRGAKPSAPMWHAPRRRTTPRRCWTS